MIMHYSRKRAHDTSQACNMHSPLHNVASWSTKVFPFVAWLDWNTCEVVCANLDNDDFGMGIVHHMTAVLQPPQEIVHMITCSQSSHS